MADDNKKPQRASLDPQEIEALGHPEGNLEAILDRASQALAALEADAGASLAPFPLEEFGGSPEVECICGPASDGERTALGLELELGSVELPRDEVRTLRTGAVVALEESLGDPISIFIAGQLVGRGEVLVLNQKLCIRVTELMPECRETPLGGSA